jgi:hypothetical protein
MVKRCPHCQTRPLQSDATVCWYCGRGYSTRAFQRLPMRMTAKRTAGGDQASRCSLRGQAEASIVAR